MNPILMEFPNELETERLYIRLPMPGDGKAVYEAITASIEEFKIWLPFARREQSEETIEANIRESHAKFLLREDLRLLIFLKETGQFIGSSGLHRINWNIPKFEIGYWLDTRFSGKGYMTEAVQGISDFAFQVLGARRVEIRCDTQNARSNAIPKRLGFALEGTFHNDDLNFDGDLSHTHIYAKTR